MFKKFFFSLLSSYLLFDQAILASSSLFNPGFRAPLNRWVSQSVQRTTISIGRLQRKDPARLGQIAWLKGKKDQEQRHWEFNKLFQKTLSDVSKGNTKNNMFLSAETFKLHQNKDVVLNFFDPPSFYLESETPKIPLSQTTKLDTSDDAILDIDAEPPLGDLIALKKWFAVLLEQNEKFQKGEANISNFEFDLFKKKLQLMFASLPDNILESMKELPQDTEIKEAFSVAELAAYFTKVDKSLGNNATRSFFYSPVINGVPFNVVYKSGVLHEAYVLLGDSKKIDIYNFVRENVSIPRILVDPINAQVKGTLCMECVDFVALNILRRNSGKKMWIDTRSAIISSILGSTDPNIELDFKLKALFYDFTTSQKLEDKITTQGELLKKLSDLGFPVLSSHHHKVATRVSAISTAIDLSKMHFETLGILIRINDRKEEALSLNQMCLYKHTPQLFEGRITNIEYKVLSNGILIALIILEGGESPDKTLLRKVLTSDVNEFNKLKPAIGDYAVVSVSQSLLPRIVKIRKNVQALPQSTFPTSCPICSAELTKFKIGESLALCCSAHLSCKDNTLQSVERFVNVSGFNIPTLSRKIIQKLIGVGLIFSPVDIFQLEEKDFAIIEEIPKEMYRKILEDIAAAKTIPLASFIYANIPDITIVAAEKLSYLFGTLKRIEDKISNLDELKRDFDDQTIEAIRKIIPSGGKPPFSKLINDCGIVILEPREEVVLLCYDSGLSDINAYQTIINRISKSDENYSLNDFEYDLLVERAKKMEEKNPSWKRTEDLSRNRNKLPWTEMVHMSKTYSIEDLKTWLTKNPDIEYIVEPKVNGIAIILNYKNGKLVSAVTKGRSTFGSEITDTIKRSAEIPSTLPVNITGNIRGELYISESDFEQLNKERADIGQPIFVDALSALLSGLKNVGQKGYLSRVIRFYPFDLKLEANTKIEADVSTRKNIRTFLDETLNFSSNGFALKTNNVDELVKYVSNVETRRLDFPFDIDGVIVRPINSNITAAEDFHHCFAFKYNQEILKSQINNVHFSVSPKGFLQASVIIDPIRFSNNRVVSKVFLEDPGELKDIRKKSIVEIMYSGGVRPKLISVQSPDEETPEKVEFPRACPNCKTKLSIDIGGRWRCKNVKCQSKTTIAQNPLIFFAKIMNFGFGHLRNNGVVLNLVRSGYVSKISDFYNLLPEEVIKHTNLSRENVSSFLAQVERSRNVTPTKFLWALKIPRINYNESEKIMNVMGDVKSILDFPLEELVDKLSYAGVSRRSISSLTNYIYVHEKELRLLLDQHIKFNDGREINEEPSAAKDSVYELNKAKLLDVYSALTTRLVMLTDEMEQELGKFDPKENSDVQLSRKESYRFRALISNAVSVTKFVQKSESRFKHPFKTPKTPNK